MEDRPTRHKKSGKYTGTLPIRMRGVEPREADGMSYKNYEVQQCPAHDVRVHFWGRKVDHAEQKR
jgi:hypothetical protein